MPSSSYYWPGDVFSIMGWQTPYLRLGNSSILRFLQTTRELGRRYEKFLPLFPAVRCEPLDTFYQYRRSVASLDIHLMHDLLFFFSWRAANYAAWLAVLAPRSEYIPLLLERRKDLPHGTTAVDLALAACGHASANGLQEHEDLVRDIRAMVFQVSCEKMPLRIAPAHELQREYEREARHIKAIYHLRGSSEAWKLTQTGIIGYFKQSHQQWLKGGARPVPND